MKKSVTRSPRKNRSYQQQQKHQAIMGLGFFGVLVLTAVTAKISWVVVGWYLAMSFITYLVYAKDKRAAQQKQWRVPESTLHLLSVLGGWVGAMVAQSYLRHKTQKPGFRRTYYLTVILNLAALLYLISGGDISQL